MEGGDLGEDGSDDRLKVATTLFWHQSRDGLYQWVVAMLSEPFVLPVLFPEHTDHLFDRIGASAVEQFRVVVLEGFCAITFGTEDNTLQKVQAHLFHHCEPLAQFDGQGNGFGFGHWVLLLFSGCFPSSLPQE